MSAKKKPGNYYRTKKAQNRKDDEKQARFIKKFIISHPDPEGISSSFSNNVSATSFVDDADENERTIEVSFSN